MTSKEKKDLISNLISDFTTELSTIFDCSLKKAFMVAILVLSNNELPYFANLSEENNNIISNYYSKFKNIEYKPSEMRRAYSESYLMSLRDEENYTVNVTLELPLIYLKMIAETLLSKTEYTVSNVLNALGNNGNLACMLSISDIIKDSNLYVTVKDDIELGISKALRDLTGFNYEITKDYPSLNYRCDLLISDPFLRKAEDILIFFEDYLEYLNQGGYVVAILPTQFVRSRIFSDLINDHSLVLLGLIEYPKDILEGLISSSIVILEKKISNNREFFHAEMPSIKDIDGNIDCMNKIKEYINNYLGE